ncbi:MAG: alanine racemase C-terminal domain-containing protein, partial [Vagococcus sp.]
KLELRPVMEIKARLISKRYVQAGDYVGYGTDTKLTKMTLVGVVSIGYADGISRSLSQAGFQVSYQGNTLPLIGSICMDMILIDLGNVPTISVGEEVVVLDDFEELALMSHTITNETLSQLGRRLVTDVVK